ncbi:MAG: hypothetical protein C0606_00460 [Hyphomicrobiales bacterium]|nr:MAG: hypothetical protein C0606_00460 [Hyphomicrobiales bacterium]
MAESKASKNDPSGATDWASLRVAYEGGAEPVAALCRRFGVSAGRLYRRARKEDWQRRSTRKADETTASVVVPAVPDRLPPLGAAERRNLIERLYRACEVQIAEVESRFLAEGTEGRPREADAKHLGALVQTLSKLTDLDAANRETCEAETEPTVDLDELRAELARRLDRLCAKDSG